MKIGFFEVKENEKEYIKSKFPKDELFFSEYPLSENVLFEDVKDLEVVSVFIYSKLDQKVLKLLPKVKLIATRSTGFDHIDLKYCNEKKITVVNVPNYGDNTVAEHTFALILALSRKLVPSIEMARTARFENESLCGFDLKDKTIGIIGTGNIGAHVVRMANGFEMNILGYDVKKDQELVSKYNLKYEPLENLLANSDIITLHLPAIKETLHIINEKNYKKIKKGAYLINTSRGALIETKTLVEALQDGTIAGAGLDVFEEEADIKEECQLISQKYVNERLTLNIANNILLRDPRVIATPHNAFNSKEALQRILSTSTENIESYKNGKIINKCS